MDFDRYTIFCYECNDYVYDLEIDEKITKTEIVSSSNKIFIYKMTLYI